MKHVFGKMIVLATLLAVPSAAFASSLIPPASPQADEKPKAKDKDKDKAKSKAPKKKDQPAPAPSH
jgi:hypothetical protein